VPRNGKLKTKGAQLVINGEIQQFDLNHVQSGSYHLILNGVSFEMEVLQSDTANKEYLIKVNGKKVAVNLRTKYDELLKELGMDSSAALRVGDLKAPMPGLVVNIPVEEGQSILKGDTLLVLEAMKMENSLKASADAISKKDCSKKGTSGRKK
jgi:acetyl/propionyl-CoA carboxylase alpha subunit